MAQGRIWLILLLGVVVNLLLVLYASLDQILIALKSFRWTVLPLVFALTTTAYIVRFVKWDLFLRLAGVQLSFKENLFVFFSGLSMVVTPGKMGEVWKGWLIKGLTGERLSKTVPVIVVDRVTDVMGLALLSLLGLFYGSSQIYPLLILPIFLILLIASLRFERVTRLLLNIVIRKTERHAQDIRAIYETFQRTTEPKWLFSLSLLGAMGWALEGLALYMVVRGLGLNFSAYLAVFIFSLASLAGAASMIPGGLGVAEATISGMLQIFGIPPAASAGSAILTRLGTLWYGASLGLSVYLLFRSKFPEGGRDGQRQRGSVEISQFEQE